MYENLLEQIIYHHSRTKLAKKFSKHIFKFISYGFDECNVLVFNDSRTINIYEISFDEKRFCNEPNKLTSWLKFVENNCFQSITSDCKVIDDLAIKKEYCSHCKDIFEAIGIENHLCRKYIGDIKLTGKLKSKYPTSFYNHYKPRQRHHMLWYIIDTVSLNLWYNLDNNICHKYKITFSEILSYSPLTRCYFDISSDKRCLLCKSQPYGMDDEGMFKCEQCYIILSYRNRLLKQLIISKLLSFHNLCDINSDIKQYISGLLIFVQIIY